MRTSKNLTINFSCCSFFVFMEGVSTAYIGLNTVRLIVIIFLASVKKSHVFNLIT